MDDSRWRPLLGPSVLSCVGQVRNNISRGCNSQHFSFHRSSYYFNLFLMCAWLCFYFLSLFNVLFVAHAFSYFLFVRAYIIVLYSADVGRILYCCERDGLPVVNPYHFAFRFWAWLADWLAGWLWMTTSIPVPSARQGNVHD